MQGRHSCTSDSANLLKTAEPPPEVAEVVIALGRAHKVQEVGNGQGGRVRGHEGLGGGPQRGNGGWQLLDGDHKAVLDPPLLDTGITATAAQPSEDFIGNNSSQHNTAPQSKATRDPGNSWTRLK